MNDIGQAITDSARQLYGTLAQHLPSLLGAILLLAVGWVVARVARALAARGMQILEVFLQRISGRPASVGLRTSATMFSTLTFWVVTPSGHA
jgi:flagellar biogenesis protein FliO